jgi:hypothetical protein
MSPAEYYDWWFFSGICPGIPTRPANHAALCGHLSAPGVHLVVLWELLRENDGAADTAYVGYQWIDGAAGRIAAAAQEVGAGRLAAWMSALPDPPAAPQDSRVVTLIGSALMHSAGNSGCDIQQVYEKDANGCYAYGRE